MPNVTGIDFRHQSHARPSCRTSSLDTDETMKTWMAGTCPAMMVSIGWAFGPAMTISLLPYYSVQSEFAVDGLELGRLDQFAMRHAH
jgi:hypothetical protein